MTGSRKGFTLVEIMVVVVILGVLAGIAIPNFIASANRAKEASLKANMHAMQFAAEDYLIKSSNTLYADHAADIVGALPRQFENPFDGTVGAGNAWEDRASVSANPTPRSGLTSYADSAQASYNIKGHGAKTVLALVLTTGLSPGATERLRERSDDGTGPFDSGDVTQVGGGRGPGKKNVKVEPVGVPPTSP